jgi:integrase
MAKTGRPRRGPWFRKSDQCYYTTFNGKQQNLGSDETQAWKQYSDLMAGREPVISSSRRTVAQLIDEFLEWTKQNRAERTYEWYRDHLRRFFQRIGPRLRVADLKPYHVSRWLTADYAGHSSSNRHGAIRSVQRALNWAVKEGYIVVNPVAKMEKPTPRPRETTITGQQFTEMLRLANGQEFKDYIAFMRETGARPFEVRTVEAHHFDGEKLVFEKINSKGERYNRVVYLNPRAQEIIERLVRDHPQPVHCFAIQRAAPGLETVCVAGFGGSKTHSASPDFVRQLSGIPGQRIRSAMASTRRPPASES